MVTVMAIILAARRLAQGLVQGLGGRARWCHIRAAPLAFTTCIDDQESPLTLTRRRMLSTTATFALAAAAGTVLAPLMRAAKAETTETDLATLAKAGPDGDVVLGSEKAPVTIIEYASLTCPHCAHFSETTFPELQKRYIDTGKVRFIFREFPLDALAAAGFMLARCAGKDKFVPVVEALFAKQREWMVEKPIEPLRDIAKQFGFTQQTFDDCLTNQKVLDGIQEVRDRAAEKLGVNSTPTFFINGKKFNGDQSIEMIAKEIDPYLKEG
jgi:protein-disulfide isomerase